MQHFTNTLSRQDAKLSRFRMRDNSRTLQTNEGAFKPQVVFIGGASQIISKVGNVVKSSRQQRAIEATERVHQEIAYKVQYLSRKQRRAK